MGSLDLCLGEAGRVGFALAQGWEAGLCASLAPAQIPDLRWERLGGWDLRQHKAGRLGFAPGQDWEAGVCANAKLGGWDLH